MEIFTTDTACGIRDGEKLWVIVAANTVYPTWLGDIPVLFPRLAAPATGEGSKLPDNIPDESAQCRALRETPSSTVYVAVDAVPRVSLFSGGHVNNFQDIVSVTFQLLAGMYIASTHYGLIHSNLSPSALYVKNDPLERRELIEFAIGSYLYRVPQGDPLVYTLDLSRAETVTRPMPSADGMGRVTRDLRAIGTIMGELMEDNRGSLSPLEWNALESLRSRLTVDADTLLLAPTITSTQQSSPYLLHLSHYLFFERHIVGPTREVQWTDAPPLWVAPQDEQRLEHLQIAMQVRDRGKQWTREELEKMTIANLYQEFKFLFPETIVKRGKLQPKGMNKPDVIRTITVYLAEEANKRELEREAEEARIRAEQEEEEARRAREAERKAAEEVEQARIRAEREATEKEAEELRKAEERERAAQAEREREEAEAARAAQDAEETEDTVVQAGGLPPQLLAGIIPVQGNWQRCVQEMVDVAKEPPQDSADVFRGQANKCLQLIYDLFSTPEWTDVDKDTKEFLQQLRVITAQGKLVQVTKTGKFRIHDKDPLGNAFQAAYVLLGLTTIATAIRSDIAAGSPWINSNLSEIKELRDRIDAVPDDTYQRDLPAVVEELVAGIPFLKKGKQEEEEDEDQTPPLSPREQEQRQEEEEEEDEDQTPPLSPRGEKEKREETQRFTGEIITRTTTEEAAERLFGIQVSLLEALDIFATQKRKSKGKRAINVWPPIQNEDYLRKNILPLLYDAYIMFQDETIFNAEQIRALHSTWDAPAFGFVSDDDPNARDVKMGLVITGELEFSPRFNETYKNFTPAEQRVWSETGGYDPQNKKGLLVFYMLGHVYFLKTAARILLDQNVSQPGRVVKANLTSIFDIDDSKKVIKFGTFSEVKPKLETFLKNTNLIQGIVFQDYLEQSTTFTI